LISRVAAVALIVTVGGCAALPEVPGGTCGNHVVEPGEDCDGFSPDSMSLCIPEGMVGECHLDCRRRGDGSSPSCPRGWGCNPQNVCKPPTGDFQASAPFKVGGAWSLLAGDFDGDGRKDIVSLEPQDLRGATKIRFHYFDANGVLADTQTFPKLLASPAITDLSRDGRSDLVFSDEHFSVGVLLGQSDRGLVPETAGSYHFPNAGVRMLGVYDAVIQRSSPVLGLTTIGGVSGLYGPDQRGMLVRRGTLPGPVEMLVGDPTSGNVIEDPLLSPCREVVVAVRGATSFPLIDTCTRDATTQQILWRDQSTQWTVMLDPPAPIDVAPQLADIDGDGHLDVFLGAGGKTYVAHGDGRGLRTATPYLLLAEDPAQPPSETPMPLAAGDFTGDGAVDFVFGDHLLVSIPALNGSVAAYIPSHINQAAPWTVARIADLNANGKADVVAASNGRLGVDFFNGTGTANVIPFTVPTGGPIEHMVVADLDGDLTNDLIFAERAGSPLERDSVMIAFGNLAGPPAMPVPVARIGHIEQLSAFSDSGPAGAGVSIAYTETTAGGSNGVLAVLSSSGDRLPFAPYELVSVSDGSLFRSAAVALAAGKFTDASSGDVLALGLIGDFPQIDYTFWLLPSLGIAPSTAVRLGGQIDPRLRPLYIDGFHVGINATTATADLDGDGRDEALWAIPADENVHCGLVVVGMKTRGVESLVVRGTIVLDQPCPGAQLVPVDADGDGHVDIAVLTGAPGAANRKLMVLWNDGAGAFASADAAIVNGPEDSPEQFTVLPATLDRPLGLAYVTDQAAVLVTATATPRAFGPSRRLAELQHGSGIVAADVDGDGVQDLAIAASGNLSVLKATLAAP
jgi:hypothetical protein